jgi:hypothetical protein
MYLASAGALAAFVSAIAMARAAPSATVWVETWRMYGFLVFALMFLLLGARPRRSAGIWELAFLHKFALAATAPTLLGAREVAMAATVDGVLALMLVVAYVCTRGWRAWSVREPN